MKNRLLNLVKKVIAPMALVTAMAAFSPVTVMAQNRGGHEGGRGGFSVDTPMPHRTGETSAGIPSPIAATDNGAAISIGGTPGAGSNLAGSFEEIEISGLADILSPPL